LQIGNRKREIQMRLPLLLLLVLFTAVFASQNKDTEPNQAAPDVNEQSEQKQKGPAQKKVRHPEHTHPAFSQRCEEREKMVARQIRARGVRDPNVLASMRTVPRHAFVRQKDLRRAYTDRPLPIGLGQTISQPYIVAYMTDALKLRPEFKVLEVGTGSGYQAAVCAELVKEVYTIEIIEALAKSAEKRLKKLGYRNVSTKFGDGYFGWEQKAPFDAIIVTAAAGFVPPPLIQQLKPDGKMILPLGSPFGAQSLVLITKDDKGNVRSQELLPVRFVPMVGQIMKAETAPER